MKKIIFVLLGILSTSVILSQTQAAKPVLSNKIILIPGQKILMEGTISVEASLMGINLTGNTASENTLEVKTSTGKNYIISSTLTKLKVDMDMMGQPTNYDSEKKGDPDSEIEKAFAGKLNNPIDITIDNSTGMIVQGKKKEVSKDPGEENPMADLLSMFADNSDDAIVSGAFELIPPGKSIGDSWSDSTVEKDMKAIRVFTLKSITGNEAVIQLDITTNAANKVNVQGMEMELKSNSKITGEIVTDITTGQVKKKNSQSDITGSIPLMGQDMPISGKVTSASTYK